MKAHAPWEGSRTSEIHKSVYIRTLACAGLQEFYLKSVKQGQSLEVLLVFPARASWPPPKVPMILGKLFSCTRHGAVVFSAPIKVGRSPLMCRLTGRCLKQLV